MGMTPKIASSLKMILKHSFNMDDLSDAWIDDWIRRTLEPSYYSLRRTRRIIPMPKSLMQSPEGMSVAQCRILNEVEEKG